MNYHLILNIPQLCVEVYCKKIKALKLWDILGFDPQIYTYRRQHTSGKAGGDLQMEGGGCEITLAPA